MHQCKRCQCALTKGTSNLRFDKRVSSWLCDDCRIKFDHSFDALRRDFFNPEPIKEKDNFFPPPWNWEDYPEKTEGWVSFQKEVMKHPSYYGILKSFEMSF